MPVAHADVDARDGLALLVQESFEECGLFERPAGEGWAFGERFVAEADLCVAVLEFFDDVLGEGATVGNSG